VLNILAALSFEGVEVLLEEEVVFEDKEGNYLGFQGLKVRVSAGECSSSLLSTNSRLQEEEHSSGEVLLVDHFAEGLRLGFFIRDLLEDCFKSQFLHWLLESQAVVGKEGSLRDWKTLLDGRHSLVVQQLR